MLFVLAALCLAVWTVPEEKDDESDDEDDVWNDDGRNDGGQVLGIVVSLNHYPRIDFAFGKKECFEDEYLLAEYLAIIFK